MLNDLTMAYLEVPPEDWDDLYQSLDMPRIELSACGFILTGLSLVLDGTDVDLIAPVLADFFKYKNILIFFLDQKLGKFKFQADPGR